MESRLRPPGGHRSGRNSGYANTGKLRVGLILRPLPDQHGGDLRLLVPALQILLHYGWWIDRKDREGHNLFEGCFLGLDNISPFNRSTARSPCPPASVSSKRTPRAGRP